MGIVVFELIAPDNSYYIVNLNVDKNIIIKLKNYLAKYYTNLDKIFFIHNNEVLNGDRINNIKNNDKIYFFFYN
jgi:hypothetical protein